MSFTCTEVGLLRHNYAFLYQYSDSHFRLVDLRSSRAPGWEERNSHHVGKCEAGNEEKLSSSISRTRSTIFELAICNDWQYFVTLTLDPERVHDRQDLRKISKVLRKFISNYNQRKAGAQVKYLLIPEKHKDGSWHFHGLMSGIPESDLHHFLSTEHLPYKILDKLNNGFDVFSWQPYAGKFGFCDLEPVRSAEGVSRYMTKYITKDLENSVTEQNAHLYYSSSGLHRKTRLAEGYLKKDFEADFENDYVRIKSSSDPSELAQYLCD